MQKSLNGNLKNSFFDSILYCLFFQVNWLTEDNKSYKDKAEEKLGKEIYDKFKEKKRSVTARQFTWKCFSKMSDCQWFFRDKRFVS